MKKALFILNPSSGSQDFWKDVEAVIGCLVLNEIINHADVVYTEKKYDAREAARGLRRGQYDVVVAVGGDGTVSDVINGIIKGKSGIGGSAGRDGGKAGAASAQGRGTGHCQSCP